MSKIIEAFGKTYRVSETGTYYHVNTPEAVISELEKARAFGRRIRVFYGYTETEADGEPGTSWDEENDVVGYVGRSTGSVKVPLLVYNKRSTGGGALLDHCIVAILGQGGGWLYRHPAFRVRAMTCKWLKAGDDHFPEYAAEVLRALPEKDGGEVVARFRSIEKAGRWLAFMTGKRFSK